AARPRRRRPRHEPGDRRAAPADAAVARGLGGGAAQQHAPLGGAGSPRSRGAVRHPADAAQSARRADRRIHAPQPRSGPRAGAAVAVVKDGKLVFAQGYGVRTLGDTGRVDPHTLFQIASNTKAFTTAALAMLADEGKLSWDDPVTKYLPAFQLYDPYVTREFTLRDLVTHRSGLGLGAGDLLWFHSSYGRAEIIHHIRAAKPVSSFRSRY